MRIFPLDIAFGLLFVIGILLMITGYLVLRYRGGKGPILLIGSGAFLTASSVFWILGSIDVAEIPRIIPIIGSVMGSIAFVLSLIFWRERD